MTWSHEHATALRSVFLALNENGVSWLVLRNYEGLPDVNRSKDIDLGIASKDITRAARVIATALAKHGFNRAFVTHFLSMHCATYFKVTESRVVSIKIDLMDGFVWRGAHVFDASKLYAGRVRHDDFYVPNHVYDGVMLLVKPLMIGAGVKPGYVDDILNASTRAPEQYRDKLRQIFGQQMGDKLWLLLEQQRFDEITSQRRSASWAAWKQAARNDFGRIVVASFKHFYLEIARRSRRRPASFLAVVGPDGVGKTTFINLLQTELARIFVKEKNDIQLAHFRPHILPNIKQLFSGKKYDVSKEEFSKPHRASPASAPSSLVRLAYYWADYLLGYWLANRRKCARGTVMIFDRYFYDFIVDPRRSRINLPTWLRILFLYLTPQPDLVFFLDCDAEVVYARKQELSKEEIQRQLNEYRKLVAVFPSRFLHLDAGRPPGEMVDIALHEMVTRLYRKI